MPGDTNQRPLIDGFCGTPRYIPGMDIKRIVDEFTSAKSAQETESTQRREALKATRETNAGQTSGHLRSVVAPVLTAASAEVQRSGYPADCESFDAPDPVGGRQSLLTLTLRASSTRKQIHKELSPHLSYAASFDDLTITVSQRFDASNPGEIRKLPFKDVTKTLVETQVEFFLKTVFRTPTS